MKSIQFYVAEIARVFFGGPENRPRVRVYLNGFNDIGNGFQSYNLDPLLSVGGDNLNISNATYDFGLQPIRGVPTIPAIGVPPGLPTFFQYVTNLGGIGQGNAIVIPQGFNRTLWQTMQQIAIYKPFVKYIKVQLYNYTPGFTDLAESLGKMYVGKMGEPLFGDKPSADVYDLRQYYKPTAFNSGFNSPQDYLANINNFSTQLKYIELDVPINRVFDGDTLLAVDAPVETFSACSQLVTLYIE